MRSIVKLMSITSLLAAVALGFALAQERTKVASGESAQIEHGKYVTVIGGCNDCHTPGYAPAGGKAPLEIWLTGDRLGFRGPWGTTYATNLRLYFQGLSEDQWVVLAKTMKTRPPMPWFSLNAMAEDDLRAMYKFVRSLGPAGEPAPQALPPDEPTDLSQAQPRQSLPQHSAQAPQPPLGQTTSQESGAVPATTQGGAEAAMRDQDTRSFISTRELLGIEVRDRNDYGRTLGRVASVILERSTGRAVYFVLEWGGLLGWDRDRVVVPYSLLHFAGQWDRPTLDVPADKIENAPQFQNQDLDTLLSDPVWQRAIADYFRTALTPDAPPSPSGPRQATQPGTAAPRAPTGADPKHGEALAQGLCAACHTLNQGGSTRVGPNLFGVFERPVASVPGYNYSTALKAHHGAWDEANLNAFLKDPRADAPGTFMTFAGISSDSDRRDVIAYLESLKAGAAK